jgi:hypothetical protein
MAIKPLEASEKLEYYEEWSDLKEVTDKSRRGAYNHTWLPKAEGKASLYVIGLKTDCPRKSLSVFGITFERNIVTPMTELGQMQVPVKTVVELTPNQLEALKVRLDDKTWEFFNSETGDYETFKGSDYVTFAKLPIKEYEKNTIDMYSLDEILSRELLKDELSTQVKKGKK